MNGLRMRRGEGERGEGQAKGRRGGSGGAARAMVTASAARGGATGRGAATKPGKAREAKTGTTNRTGGRGGRLASAAGERGSSGKEGVRRARAKGGGGAKGSGGRGRKGGRKGAGAKGASGRTGKGGSEGGARRRGAKREVKGGARKKAKRGSKAKVTKKSKVKRTGRSRRRGGPKRGPSAVAAWFPAVRSGGGGGGLGVAVAVIEGVAGEWDVCVEVDDRTVAARGAGRQGRAVGWVETARAAKGMATRARLKSLSRTLAALAHASRAAIVVKLLEGPANYRALQKVTGMKAGPLYHHVNQLRIAGLILPKERDVYGLTRGGRNVILGALALTRLAGDRRARPVDTV